MKINTNKNISNAILAIAIIMGFIFIVSIAIYFIREHYSLTCSCKISLPLVISILTSLGVFVGFLTYYFLSKSFNQEKEKIVGDIEKTLNFLEKEEKQIIKALINNNGVCKQNEISKITGINPVKLHRKLANLESKQIISKTKSGMTNTLILNEDYKDIFVK